MGNTLRVQRNLWIGSYSQVEDVCVSVFSHVTCVGECDLLYHVSNTVYKKDLCGLNVVCSLLIGGLFSVFSGLVMTLKLSRENRGTCQSRKELIELPKRKMSMDGD